MYVHMCKYVTVFCQESQLASCVYHLTSNDVIVQLESWLQETSATPLLLT